MDFLRLEHAGKTALERFPSVKRAAKRMYQLASVGISKEKLKSEGNIYRVSPDDGYEYFFGYYDKSPWDSNDRYILCLKVERTDKTVAPKEIGTIGVIDTQNHDQFEVIATTHCWNVQQGCMAQWLGPDYCSHILYNDFRDGHYCTVIYNFETKSEEKILPRATYDISRDGRYALSLDFSRLHRMRPGYGYSNLPDETKGELCPDKPCIWKVDTETGEATELLKYTDLAAFEPESSMTGAEHKVNHIMICPNGKRFMFLHRWYFKGRKYTRLITVNADGTGMYDLCSDGFVSHCFWKNDNEILSFLRKKNRGEHYYLLRDETQQFQVCWPELASDGHCSYSPNGKYIITDTYPNRNRIASVYLCTQEDNRSRRIARVYAPFKYDNDCRCDLHPRWDRAGKKICIDSVHDGKRGLYVIPVDKITENIHFYDAPNGNNPETFVSFIIPAYNAEKTIDKCIESVIDQTSSRWEMIVIDDGSTDGTGKVLEKYNNTARIKRIYQDNSGPGQARNEGLKIASGKYISFLDADDYMESNFVEEAKKIAGATNADIIFYETIYENEAGEKIKTSKIYRYAEDSKDSFITRQMSGAFSWGACKLIKRELISRSEARFSGHDVGEEAIFTFKVLKSADRIEFLKMPVYHYVQHDAGQHKKGNDDPLGAAVIAMKEYLLLNDIGDQYESGLDNMAAKALAMSLYRCSAERSYFTARKEMTGKIEEYTKEFDFRRIDTSRLSKSVLLVWPFIKARLLLPIYIVSKIKSNNKY